MATITSIADRRRGTAPAGDPVARANVVTTAPDLDARALAVPPRRTSRATTTWSSLVELEPRLGDLLEEIRALPAMPPTGARSRAWFGRPRHGRRAQGEDVQLVGWWAEQDDPMIRSDVAYRVGLSACSTTRYHPARTACAARSPGRSTVPRGDHDRVRGAGRRDAARRPGRRSPQPELAALRDLVRGVERAAPLLPTNPRRARAMVRAALGSYQAACGAGEHKTVAKRHRGVG